jgi:alpha-tubulin suppressor-like RCC1 family protein
MFNTNDRQRRVRRSIILLFLSFLLIFSFACAQISQLNFQKTIAANDREISTLKAQIEGKPTQTEAPTSTPVPTTYALRFDGIDDYVDVPTTNGYTGLSSVTLASWVRLLSLPAPGKRYGIIVSGDSNGCQDNLGVMVNEYGQLYVTLGTVNNPSCLEGPIAITTTGKLEAGQWHFISITYSTETGKFNVYIDAIPVGEYTADQSGLSSQYHHFGFGRWFDGNVFPGEESHNLIPFHGDLDEISLWNKALSSSELLNLMHHSPDGNQPGLIGFWDFNEGDGQTAKDLTGNNNGQLGSLATVDENDPTWFMVTDRLSSMPDRSNLFTPSPTSSVQLQIGVLNTITYHPISTGGEHTCALTKAGGVKCWGLNSSGQLGDDTTTDRHAPVDVVGLGSSVTAISAGIDFTCALTSTGGVKCWGRNNSYQLGDGTTTDRPNPVDVVGLSSGVTAISAGIDFTCALTSAGGVKCWGSNNSGQLGDNTTYARPAPVDVVGLSSGVTAISAGGHTCALTSAGGVKCWGTNGKGELGDNTTYTRLTPVDVVGLSSGVIAISAGYFHTCVLMDTGGVKCWGWNQFGELGDDTTTDRWAPVDVVGLSSGITAVAASDLHTCALTSAGGVKCWGQNEFGQLGDNTKTNRWTPVDVVGLSSGVTAFSSVDLHTCALTSAGRAKCWGDNIYGQLGDDQVDPNNRAKTAPVDVVGFP